MAQGAEESHGLRGWDLRFLLFIEEILHYPWVTEVLGIAEVQAGESWVVQDLISNITPSNSRRTLTPNPFSPNPKNFTHTACPQENL